jgi:flavin reductase (DIM6/NTAB) family NADH-FMN oxidoreductase RutF
MRQPGHRHGRERPEGTALLRTQERPRPQARPVQRHGCSAPDRLDFFARQQGQSTSWKDSVQNIKETGEFVWNLATMDLAKQMNATAAHVARDVNEFEIAGLTPAPCKLVNVPRVGESPVPFECKLTQIVQLEGADAKKAEAWLTPGEVVGVHLDKAMVRDDVYQTALARPIVRAGRRGDYFEIRPDAQFEMVRPD